MIASKNSPEKHLGEIFTTNTTWSKVHSYDLRLIKSEKSASCEVLPDIQKLVQKLTELPHVARVRAVALKYPDLHNIDIELELSPETELSYEAWEQVQDIVIDSEWKLRDDSGEKWYFHAEFVNKLSPLRDAIKVIVDSHDIQLTKVRTWSSPDLKLVEHKSPLATF